MENIMGSSLWQWSTSGTFKHQNSPTRSWIISPAKYILVIFSWKKQQTHKQIYKKTIYVAWLSDSRVSLSLWFPPLFLEEEPECGLEQYLMTQLIIAGMFHYLVRKNDDILG